VSTEVVESAAGEAHGATGYVLDADARRACDHAPDAGEPAAEPSSESRRGPPHARRYRHQQLVVLARRGGETRRRGAALAAARSRDGHPAEV
jgi:hypothetical protein